MIRQVSTLVAALCLSGVALAAQSAATPATELTVDTPTANVFKYSMIASPIIAKVQRGTVLEIKRNLGAWVEVPWPTGEDGVAYVRVSAGTIAKRAVASNTKPTGVSTMASRPSPPSSASIQTSSASRIEQAPTNDRVLTNYASYMSLPRHIIGVGGRMSASGPGFGATGRFWWKNGLGVQGEVSHSQLNSTVAPGRVTSMQFAPSVVYSLPDAVAGSLWVRPYAGAGISMYRSTLNGVIAGLDEPTTSSNMGFQAFGGGEATFSAAPRFAISADVGYRKTETAFTGFEPKKIGFSVAAHWYVK